MTYSPPWPDERVDRLRKLWEGGSSGAQCAALINWEFSCNITRNACVGQANRRGFIQPNGTNNKARAYRARAPRPKAKRPHKLTRLISELAVRDRAKVQTTQPVAPVMSSEVEPVPRHLSLFELKDTYCKYPFGESPYITFCGHPSEPGLSWCGFHKKIVWPRSG